MWIIVRNSSNAACRRQLEIGRTRTDKGIKSGQKSCRCGNFAALSDCVLAMADTSSPEQPVLGFFCELVTSGELCWPSVGCLSLRAQSEISGSVSGLSLRAQSQGSVWDLRFSLRAQSQGSVWDLRFSLRAQYQGSVSGLSIRAQYQGSVTRLAPNIQQKLEAGEGPNRHRLCAWWSLRSCS